MFCCSVAFVRSRAVGADECLSGLKNASVIDNVGLTEMQQALFI
jgi:hypothetical protein